MTIQPEEHLFVIVVTRCIPLQGFCAVLFAFLPLWPWSLVCIQPPGYMKALAPLIDHNGWSETARSSTGLGVCRQRLLELGQAPGLCDCIIAFHIFGLGTSAAATVEGDAAWLSPSLV